MCPENFDFAEATGENLFLSNMLYLTRHNVAVITLGRWFAFGQRKRCVISSA